MYQVVRIGRFITALFVNGNKGRGWDSRKNQSDGQQENG